MAQPTTKDQFKEWCLRKLGKNQLLRLTLTTIKLMIALRSRYLITGIIILMAQKEHS